MARGQLDPLSFVHNRRFADSARRIGERLSASHRRVWVIAAVLTAFGCHEDLVAIQLGSSAGGSGASCEGDPCTYSDTNTNPCCTGYWCSQGHCASSDGGTCLARPCTTSENCCPGNICQTSPTGLKQCTNERCQLPSDCSSLSCNNSNQCDTGPYCATLNVSCSADKDCCSNICSNGVCVRDTCAVTTDSCNSDSDCCTGISGSCIKFGNISRCAPTISCRFEKDI